MQNRNLINYKLKLTRTENKMATRTFNHNSQASETSRISAVHAPTNVVSAMPLTTEYLS